MSEPKLPKREKPRGPKLNSVSSQARKVGTAILEVLVGNRTPSDAATALSVSLPRYYQLETRALNGLLLSCEPRKKGYVRSPEREVENVQKKVQQLQRECARHQALARLAQRTIGLAAPVAAKSNGTSKRKKRSPSVRALKVVEMLKSDPSGETQAGSAGEQPAKG